MNTLPQSQQNNHHTTYTTPIKYSTTTKKSFSFYINTFKFSEIQTKKYQIELLAKTI